MPNESTPAAGEFLLRLTLSREINYIPFRGASRFGGLPSFRGPRSGVGLRVSGTPYDGLLRLP